MSKPNKYAQTCLSRLIPELKGLTITGGLIDETANSGALFRKGNGAIRP